MGVRLVLERLPGATLTAKRWAGVSAGGMMPFELALKGTQTTLLNHLSYAVLMAGKGEAAWLLHQDHHWRLMAAWMTEKWSAALAPALDGRVFVGTSCLTPWPKLVLVSNYTSPEQAGVAERGIASAPFAGHEERARSAADVSSHDVGPAQAASAFMATGTVYEWYDGMPCSDGGATTPPNMTPLFQASGDKLAT